MTVQPNEAIVVPEWAADGDTSPNGTAYSGINAIVSFIQRTMNPATPGVGRAPPRALDPLESVRM